MRISMIVAVLVLVPVLALGAIPDPVPAGPAVTAGVAELSFPLPDLATVAQEDQWRVDAGLPYRFALVQEVVFTPNGEGTWDVSAGGDDRWRLRVRSRGALSLNLAFTRFFLPPGARLVLRPADGSGPGIAFDDRANNRHDELWTPIILTDDLLVELTVPAALRSDVELELGRINRGYRYFGESAVDKSGSCNIDTVCPEGDDWRAEIRSVGVYTVDGSWKCTGAMINNTALDASPLFLTADHCKVDSINDNSIVVYWNYESPSCGDLGGGSLADRQSGATWLADWASSDFCLLELADRPDIAWGVTFAGWDRSGDVPDTAVGVHHPSTDEKAISFELDPLSITTYLGNQSPGDQTHLRVADWDLGTTEAGSSGSPLFDEAHRIVGQLHGGYAACGNDLSDWYGRFFNSWTGGRTAASSLAPYLDPLDRGDWALDLLDPLELSIVVQPQTGVEFSGMTGGPFSPEAAHWTISNPGVQEVAWSVTADAPWLVVAPTGGTLAPGGEVTVTAVLFDAVDELAPGTESVDLILGNESGGTGGLTVTVGLKVLPVRAEIVTVGPNPFGSFTEITYMSGGAVPVQALIYDLRGRVVGELDGGISTAGQNVLVWDGHGSGGRHLAGGLYVVELNIGGVKDRVSLTLAH